RVPRAMTRADPSASSFRKIGVRTAGSGWRRLPRLESRFGYELPAVFPLQLDVLPELLRPIEDRDDADIQQPFATECLLVSDGDNRVMQSLDQILRGSGRGNEAEIDRRKIGKAELVQGRHVRKQRGARL